jgi:exportin-T
MKNYRFIDKLRVPNTEISMYLSVKESQVEWAPMDTLAGIESVIARANASSDPNDQRVANQMLDQLRASPERWQYGLQLFFEGQAPVSKFFGLRLVRHYFEAYGMACDLRIRNQVRMSLMQWLQGALGSNTTIEAYIRNIATSVLTLCIKFDFPEHWSTAFDDILALGEMSPQGTEVVCELLMEFDVEVVTFHEDRSRDEWTHNTAIKDTMRAQKITDKLVSFLFNKTISCKGTNGLLSNMCLKSLAPIIKWCDISLLISKDALNLLYLALKDNDLWEGACACLTEVVKKGMPPSHKVDLLVGMDVLDVMSTLPFPIDDNLAEYLGPLVNALFDEILDIWTACEKESTMMHYVNQAAALMNKVLACVLQLFKHDDLDVSSSLVPSLNRFIQVLAAQKKDPSKYYANIFDARRYLGDFLMCTYKQMQFSDDFTFDLNDEDDSMEIEVSVRIRNYIEHISAYNRIVLYCIV